MSHRQIFWGGPEYMHFLLIIEVFSQDLEPFMEFFEYRVTAAVPIMKIRWMNEYRDWVVACLLGNVNTQFLSLINALTRVNVELDKTVPANVLSMYSQRI